MSSYLLATDSSADLHYSILEENGVPVVNLAFSYDGNEYYDDMGKTDVTLKTYEALRNGAHSTTSQVNSDQFVRIFSPYLEQGQDILYIAFSSGLSGTCESAFAAQAELKTLYPDRRLVVVDTLSASMGQGLLVYHAIELKKQGKSLDEVCSWLEANKLRVNHLFTVETLTYLQRGGRISGTKAFVANILDIKPVMYVDDTGHLIPLVKARGRKKSMRIIADLLAERIVDPENQIIMISHGDCIQDAEILRDMIAEKVKVKEFIINMIGPVIGSHSGPGTLAVFFFGDKR